MKKYIINSYNNKIYNTADFFISYSINDIIYGCYLSNGIIIDTFEINIKG
jgi:hypothetical protein